MALYGSIQTLKVVCELQWRVLESDTREEGYQTLRFDYGLHLSQLEASWNVMAHVQKPDFVFRRNGRFHLNRPGPSVQSTTGSRGERNSGSNAGYTMFRGSVKGIGYPQHSPVSPSLLLPCIILCHYISTGVYKQASSRRPTPQTAQPLGSAPPRLEKISNKESGFLLGQLDYWRGGKYIVQKRRQKVPTYAV